MAVTLKDFLPDIFQDPEEDPNLVIRPILDAFCEFQIAPDESTEEEYADLGSFPGTGSLNVVYVALDTELKYRWDGTTYIEIIEGVDFEIGRLGDLFNVDKTREIDLLLQTLGNPFTFAGLTEQQRRRLAKSLIQIYKSKGTREGIIQAILFFTGFEATIDDGTILSSDLWILGVSKLGTETILAGSRADQDLFTFRVLFDDCVWTGVDPWIPDDQDLFDQIDLIVEFMKPQWTTHVLVDCFQYSLPFTDPYEGPLWPL